MFVLSSCSCPFWMTAPLDQTYLVGGFVRGLLWLLPWCPTLTLELEGESLLWFVAPFVDWCGCFERWKQLRGTDLSLPTLIAFYSQSVVAHRQNELLTIRLNLSDSSCNMSNFVISVTPDSPNHLCIDQFWSWLIDMINVRWRDANPCNMDDLVGV